MKELIKYALFLLSLYGPCNGLCYFLLNGGNNELRYKVFFIEKGEVEGNCYILRFQCNNPVLYIKCHDNCRGSSTLCPACI